MNFVRPALAFVKMTAATAVGAELVKRRAELKQRALAGVETVKKGYAARRLERER